eukprot:CAMPEP_0175251076 /NCGR_PEP_ID=MMETSP0093-20121207/35479_1 /TAXON_ID=311494 /ORGANISM="Alexandrium monilatum, Strain CCMP3105" /LENGTH=242 /DNA_ID=CAMNT_0016545335 /DNA_START=53 /DNA_END=781 /DNA_ORIENTATION=-
MALRAARQLLHGRLHPGVAPLFAVKRDLGVHCGALRAATSSARVPTREEAAAMPLAMCELSNETLIILAEQGCHDACSERLVRNIMNVDDVGWAEAKEKLVEIKVANRKVVWLVTLPYTVGITVGIVSGVGCVPMVFSSSLSKWFNANYVTTEVPEPKDLETILEVGSWTWNWMEPPLGTASFVLLALQFVRAQMLNMNLTPYTSWVQEYRAKRLSRLFPQYNDDVVKDFARTASLKPMKTR